ncbi:MAG: serine hydrolase domain-containing protein [Bacteroidales bacterium]
MLRRFLILAGLVIVFFFGEIALTFSDKGSSFIVDDNEVAFSLKIENHYSDYQSTEVIDNNVESFMDRWKIHGVSVAVTKDEELVYAKGFGFADTERKEAVKPGHLFRIASVSKLLTAAAVMKLYEEQQLDLNKIVFGPYGILDTSYYSGYKDKRYEEITVKHLLNHSAGWSGIAGDPMFNSLNIAKNMKIDPPANVDHIITYCLSRKLHFKPGTRYSYSNVGYAILGKIIEVASGMPYEDYVILKILKPAGIHDMHIGKSFHDERFPNEVTYYHSGSTIKTHSFDGSGEMVPLHYGGNNIELLAAAGGWVASAPELAKLLTVLDGYNIQQDILKKETVNLMVNPDFAGYGLFGWRGIDHTGTWWRTGYLSGSTALVVRQKNGLNWVVLLNTSTYRQSRIQRYASAMMFNAVGGVELWPYLNLFLVDQQFSNPISEITTPNPLL